MTNEEKQKIFNRYEKILKDNQLSRKDGAKMLDIEYNTYYKIKNLKTRLRSHYKFMLLFLLCKKYVSKENFKKIVEIMRVKL